MIKEILVLAALFAPTNLSQESLREKPTMTEKLLCDTSENAISVVVSILTHSEAKPVVPKECQLRPMFQSWVSDVEYHRTIEIYEVSVVTVRFPDRTYLYGFNVTVLD